MVPYTVKYSFEGSGPLIEGDFDSKPQNYLKSVKNALLVTVLRSGSSSQTATEKYQFIDENITIWLCKMCKMLQRTKGQIMM